MQISYPDFDNLLEKHYDGIYRLSFLLTVRPPDAWQAAFQAFLYMGAQTEGADGETAGQDALYAWCIRTCTDYYYRKIRRLPRRSEFQKLVPFPVSDQLWELMRLPLRKKAYIFLTCYLELPPERAAGIMEALSGAEIGAKNCPSGDWYGAIASIRPPENGSGQLSNEIYLRFEERNVPLENRLRNIRFLWDRAVIWIALALVLLFAATAHYTASLGV